MQPTRRQEGVTLLLALAGLAAARGAVVDTEGGNPTSWYVAALASVVLAFIWVSAPPSNKVGFVQRIIWARERWQLKRRGTQPGWSAGPIRVPGGTLLALGSKDAQPLRGFMCEVQTPVGLAVGYTEEALKVTESVQATMQMKLPPQAVSASLAFPRDFTTQSTGRLPPAPLLPRGRYHVLWWAWEYMEDQVSSRLLYVTGHHFEVGRGGFLE